VAKTIYNEAQFQPTRAAVHVTYDNVSLAAGAMVMDGCGVNALAMAESYVDQAYHNTMEVFDRMARSGRCDHTGRTTAGAIINQAVADGYRVKAVNFTAAGITEAVWTGFLTQHLGAGAAVVLQTNEGWNLYDLISTEHEDATLSGSGRLQRHFITLYRFSKAPTAPEFPGHDGLPNGYIASDGCNNLMNPMVAGKRTRVLGGHQPLFYTLGCIRLTQPCALVAVYPKPAPVAPVVAATPAPVAKPAVTAPALSPIKQALAQLEKALSDAGVS
jgi:hypothetical protein